MEWAGVGGVGGRQPSLALLILVAAFSSVYPSTAAPQQPSPALTFTPALTSSRPEGGEVAQVVEENIREKTAPNATIVFTTTITSTTTKRIAVAATVKGGGDDTGIRRRGGGEAGMNKIEVEGREGGEERKIGGGAGRQIERDGGGEGAVVVEATAAVIRASVRGGVSGVGVGGRGGRVAGGVGGGVEGGVGGVEAVVDLRRVLPEANLDNNSFSEIFFNDGEVALLPCQFPQLSTLHQAFLQMQVSWIRRLDWHILTTGVYTYTSDTRFSVLHQEGSDDWTLQIKYAAMNDNGTYECQMYTGTGVLSQFINLHVVAPRAAILGPHELHVQEGDTITLICVIQQGRPPFVFWYHGQQMVNYDTRLSVKTHVEGTRTHSRLTISHARSWDSGNYSCIPPNVEPSYVLVYVTEAGDTVAAVQRPPANSAPSLLLPSPIVLAALLFPLLLPVR